MDFGLIGIATLLGYKVKDRIDKSNVAVANAPTPGNVYQTNYVNAIRESEQRLADNKAQDAQNPFRTNTIPKFLNLVYTQDQLDSINNGPMFNNNFVNGLAENKRVQPTENFTHSNMQPFYRGRVKGGNPATNPGIVERFTGTVPRGRKEAIAPFQTPAPQNVYGSPAVTTLIDEDRIRQGLSNIHNYTFPVPIQFPDKPEKISRPQYKTIDEIRVKKRSQPIESRFNTGGSSISNGPVKPTIQLRKSTPGQVFEQDPLVWQRNRTADADAHQVSGEQTRIQVKPTRVIDSVINTDNLVAPTSNRPMESQTTKFKREFSYKDNALTRNKVTIPTLDTRVYPEPFKRTKKEETIFAQPLKAPSLPTKNRADRTMISNDPRPAPTWNVENTREFYGTRPQMDQPVFNSTRERQQELKYTAPRLAPVSINTGDTRAMLGVDTRVRASNTFAEMPVPQSFAPKNVFGVLQ